MSEAYLRRDHCPICAAPLAAARPAIQSKPPAESLAFAAQDGFVSGYGSRRTFFTYYRCHECGAAYCPTYFTPAQLDRLYGHQSENMAEVPLPARGATQRAYLDILSSYAGLEGEYLELGPDIGLFAGLCAERGRFSRFHLFEPNREVHGALAARLAGRNVRISADPYRAGALSAASLSIAVLIHVLDHLIDPPEVLRALHKNLAPGGTLFLVTHDEASLAARALGRRWPPYALQHPQLFSRLPLARLLERCGFAVVGSQKTVNYFPVTHLLRGVFAVLGLERLAPRFDHPLTMPVRLGNIATIARKPR
jgi:SAM-dependent methyltransferase